MASIILSFVGSQDPYSNNTNQEGSIVTLLTHLLETGQGIKQVMQVLSALPSGKRGRGAADGDAWFGNYLDGDPWVGCDSCEGSGDRPETTQIRRRVRSLTVQGFQRFSKGDFVVYCPDLWGGFANPLWTPRPVWV